MEDLRSTLVELDEHKRDTEEAQKVRTTALAKSRRIIIYGSRLLEALYILAGDEFHAARLRPHVGSRAVSADELDEPDVADGEPSDGEPSDGEPTGDEPSDEPSSDDPSSDGESDSQDEPSDSSS